MNSLNQSTLESLREALSAGDLNRLLQRVARDLIPEIGQMQGLAARGDWAGLRALAHRLRGTLGNFGCDALAETLGTLEHGLRSEPIRPPSDTDLAQIALLAHHTAAALEDTIARERKPGEVP